MPRERLTATALVTGASSGIGKAVALGLAQKVANVIIICKNQESGKSALEDIMHKSKNPNIKLFIADLSSQNAIHSLTDSLIKEYSCLDILIHCAGVLQPTRILTIDNLETTFAVNHLAPFLLTLNLLPLLERSFQARIITVTSRAEELGKINFKDLQAKTKYSPFKSYAQSKLANILFTYELARRLQNTKITVNCLHPGLVKSKLGRNLNIFMKGLLWLMRPFMMSPKKASEGILYLALDPTLNKTNGKYFMGYTEAKSSKYSYDLCLAKKIWNISESLIR